MRYALYFLTLLLAACGGSLSDEQRKKIREEMEMSRIRKVSEVEITEAAFAKGRAIVKTIESFKGDSTRIDSLLRAEGGKVRWVVPGKSAGNEMEQQLIEAYLSAETGGQPDNVQKIRVSGNESDSLLYTKPVVFRLPDGADRLEGVWNVRLSKKELILSMEK